MGADAASCCNSVFGVRLSVDLWVSSFSDFLLSYVLGLAILLGVKNYRELKYTQLRAANLQAAWTQSRLQALRMQLNPHFLFNTLNAAVALVSSRPKVAEQMLVRLADLLRRTLRDGETDFITVAREADFVRNYLEVQRLRFPDRLTFDVDVEPQRARRRGAEPAAAAAGGERRRAQRCCGGASRSASTCGSAAW